MVIGDPTTEGDAGAARTEDSAFRPLEEGVTEVKLVLGDGTRGISSEKAVEIIPTEKRITQIERDSFEQLREGPGGLRVAQATAAPDAFMYQVYFEDGSKAWILTYKSNEGNPIAPFSLRGGLDVRQWKTLTYQWNGKDTIVGTSPQGESQSYSGEWGKPQRMLEKVVPPNWVPKERTTFASVPPPAPTPINYN